MVRFSDLPQQSGLQPRLSSIVRIFLVAKHEWHCALVYNLPLLSIVHSPLSLSYFLDLPFLC